jgi:hypothetical protein
MNKLITATFEASSNTTSFKNLSIHRKAYLKNVLRLPALLLPIVLSSGCFYFIEEGQGGVAERFPVHQPTNSTVNSLAVNFPKRFDKCKKRLDEYQSSPKYMHHPVRYHKIAETLIRSQRLHDAKFYVQANQFLDQAEKQLMALQNKPVPTQPKPAKTPTKTAVVSF